jgi:signal transduction histidine kinase
MHLTRLRIYKHKFKSTLYLLIFICLFFRTQAQIPISLNSDDTSFLMGKMCLIKPDSANLFNFESILTATDFKANESEHIPVGVGENENVWLKWVIDNPKAEFAFLELAYPMLDTTTLYIVDEGKVIECQQSGQNFLPQQRFVECNNIVFKVKQSNKPLIYYMKVKARWFCNIKPRISTVKSFIRLHHFDAIIQGLFLGICGVFILYNLFVFIQFRNVVYLLYSLYLLCATFFVLRTTGYATEFIFRFTPQYNDLGFGGTGLLSIISVLFTMKFLETDTHLPKIHNILKAFLLVYVLYTIALFAKEMYWTVIISQTLIPMGTVVIFIASLTLWKRGNASAKYFFAGWFGLFVAQLVFIAENRGAIPSNFFTTYVLQFGISFEAISLSYALARHFKMLKNKERMTHTHMVELLKQNESLIKDKNKKLEHEVEERTEALTNTLSLLQESKENLKKHTQLLEKSNKELTDFAHIASHDLKAPIRGIISFTQLFERRNKAKFDDVDREYFDFIKNNARHSAQLIEAILNYSKIDKNLGESVSVDLNNAVFVVEMNLKSLMQEHNAEVISEILPPIKAHSSLIVQLLQNLIGNGIKYNKSDKPSVKIGSKTTGRNETLFYVKDNGIGIASENHEKVFGMFSRLHGQAEYEGTGIGLAFCQRIVETYDGIIYVESEVGQGTTVYFTLPKAVVPVQVLVAA